MITTSMTTEEIKAEAEGRGLIFSVRPEGHYEIRQPDFIHSDGKVWRGGYCFWTPDYLNPSQIRRYMDNIAAGKLND